METTLSSPANVPADLNLLVSLVANDGTRDPRLADVAPNALDAVTRELGRGRIRATKGDTALVTGGATGPERVLLVGVGTEADGRAEAVRIAGGVAARTARGTRAASVAVLVPAGDDGAWFVEGFLLGAYKFDRYRKAPADDAPAPALSTVTFLTDDEDALADTIAIAESVNFARDLANSPANYLTPSMLADEAVKLADEYEHLTATILDQADIDREGLGMLSAVGAGSQHESRLIVLEWNPPADKGTSDADRLAFVGKAVTFDTGGISIKPSAGMQDMKLDKSGGCAVIGAMRSIAATNVQRRVLAVVGSAENMPDGKAYKPGDVITAYDGTTIEITNTDAEGRLVLGDAISWARKLGCGGIVELSTLTGAMVVALGHFYTGAIAVAGPLTDAVLASAGRTGDHAWHLPMHDAYKTTLKSDCADMVNSGSRAGGSLFAGLFLKHFAKDTPFVHLDIAGTGMLPKAQGPFSVSGSSGWGVRLLTDLAATR